MTFKDDKNDYFSSSRDWYFDKYESVRIQANRWFLGCVASIALNIILVIGLVSLFPMKTIMPIVVHQNIKTGETWVEHPRNTYTPINENQVDADIVKYITTYESYSPDDIETRFNLVLLLSAGNIGRIYADEQSNENKHSPVNILGKEGIRKVRVEDIYFIDKEGSYVKGKNRTPTHNLAKVDFQTTTIDHSGNKKIESWIATFGWAYEGTPEKQADAWDNWNGFIVTTFRIDPKNIG